ncbi:choice-of-anchor B domain-containing protein [Haloechinothrix alba]|uniref:Choice-of-anchor B domain-containing protein n=2 Tax=Haloechinothrix alba TaxID=664784 RepID=A0A238ZKE4_9PSEU|nr:choice-of-anchor B domain-containing protein [Haloechinothrix alba]
MRARWMTAGAGILLVAVLGAAPSAAHDGGFHEVQPPPMEMQQKEFEAVAAADAEEDSNAPRGFAPCIRGMAADTYPCDGVDMLSHLTLDDLGLSFANDMWGWTDPATKKDYALVGGTEGTAFVDISDPKRPRHVGTLPAHVLDENRPFWRDIKVHDDHAFIVSEQIPHGMQVFDLTRLRDTTGEPATFDEDAHYDGIDRAHNVAVNEDTGFAYVVGSDTCEGGLHMVDITAPASPSFAGCFAGHGYIHDTQCVIYEGPDAKYRGNEICFNSNAHRVGDGIENRLSIVDVTEKDAPVALAREDYAEDGYSHQGSLTADQRYFLHGDELDEVDHGVNTRTRIWDVRDLTAPDVNGTFDNETTSIDHNIYTEGSVAYASNYTSGLRVYDTSEVASGELSEVAFFDVYPENDNATFEGGTWSNYSHFRQKGIVAVSTMDRGLFVLQPRVSRSAN